MDLRQFLHTGLMAASHLVGSDGRSARSLTDPVSEIVLRLQAGEATAMRIRYVIDMHLRADHASSGRELARAAGAEYVPIPNAGVAFSFGTLRRVDTPGSATC